MAVPPPPPHIPDYELLRLIGSGSYGDVWLARGVTGAFRAVKLVWRDRFPDLRPYEREFEGLTRFAAISLREPSQLALLHAGRNDAAGFFYYVMELADDAAHGRTIDPATYLPGTLKELFARRGRLPVAEVVALGVALARAVASLHQAGLVHRDIKPSNVILVGGVPKLADVGLVAAASDSALTFVGTEGFVPPEGPGAPAADVFSLGKLLYELVTGLDRHEFPRLPEEALAGLPDRRAFLELNEVLLRACEPDARRRFADATPLLDELLLLQAGKSVRRLRTAERRVTRALRVAAVLALVAGIAGAGAWGERQRAETERGLRAAAEAERDAVVRRTVYAGLLASAQSALRQGEFGRARQLLREARPAPGEPDLRGFEWQALHAQAQGDPSQILRASGPAIDRLALSPDGRLLAVHAADRRVTLFRTGDLRETGEVAGVSSLGGFSGDAAWLLGADAQGRPRRWRASDGSAEVAPAPAVARRILGVTAAGGLVGFADGDPAVLTVWDFSRGQPARTLTFEPKDGAAPWEFFRGGVAEGGGQAALAWVRGRGPPAEFRLTWIDLAGATPRHVHTVVPERPGAVGFDAHGAWAALAEAGTLWRYEAGAARWRPSGETCPPEVRKMVPLGADARVAADHDRLFWMDGAGRIVRTGRGQQGMIGDLIVEAGTGRVFSATHDGELRAWPATVGAAPVDARQIWNSRGGVTRVVFSPDSRELAVPADGRSVRILDSRTLLPVAEFRGMRIPAWFSGDRLIGLGTDAGYVVRARDRGGAGAGLTEAVNALQLLASADGAAVCLTDGTGRLWWEQRGAPPRPPLAAVGYENRFALRADAALARLWAAGNDRKLRLVRLADGGEVWQAALPALAPAFALSPDERTLAVPLENARLEVRDAASGELRRTVTLGGSTPQDVLFSPDGSRLFVAGSKGDIACLETANWTQLIALQLPTEAALHHLSVSPDGRMLVAVTKAGALYVVRAAADQPDAASTAASGAPQL